MRYYVNWFFVVILISSLTSFIEKDRPVEGLSIGEYAPDFVMNGDASNATDSVYSSLSALHGNYVLVNFWASYDAASRMRNIELNRALLDEEDTQHSVKFVSVSFDNYVSIFRETVRKDGIVGAGCFVLFRRDAGDHPEPAGTFLKGSGGFRALLLQPGLVR